MPGGTIGMKQLMLYYTVTRNRYFAKIPEKSNTIHHNNKLKNKVTLDENKYTWQPRPTYNLTIEIESIFNK